MKDKDEPEIRIIIDDDEKLKILGELLSNKTSRDLIRLLMNKSTYKMKLSKELGVQFSLVEHHLKKLEELGLVKITNKKLIKKGVLHKNYKINTDGIFVTFNTKEEVEQKGILKKIFKDGIKITIFGLVFISSLFFRIPLPPSSGWGAMSGISYEEKSFLPLIIIICGLLILYFKKRKKS